MGRKERVRRAKRRLMNEASISKDKIQESINGKTEEGSIGGEETRSKKPAQAEIKLITSDIVDFDKNSNDSVSLKMKIETLQMELIQTEKALNDEQRETKNLQSKHDSLAKYQEKLRQENSCLKEESDKLQAEVCSIRCTLVKVDADRERFKDWVEKLISENHEIQKSLDLLSDEHNRLKNERDLRQFAELKEKLLHVTSERDILEKENLVLEREAQDFRLLIKSLKMQLSDVTKESKLFKAQIPFLKAENENLEQEKDALEDAKEKFEEEKYVVQMEKDAICRCMKDAQIKFDTAVSELSKTLAGLSEEKKKLQESLNEKGIELAGLQQLFSDSPKKEHKAPPLLQKIFTWPHAAVLSAGVVAAAASFIKIRA